MKTKDVAPREWNGPKGRKERGLIIVYTGHGKGKSTAAFGAIFRSLGRGFRVAVVQFIKGEWISGEVKALEKFGSQVDYFSVGDGFTWNTKSLAKDVECALKGWNTCLKLLRAKNHDVYLFDELIYVLKYKFLSLPQVMRGIREKDIKAHLILTGRDAPQKLIHMADLVTEMKEIKHPYRQGILAQPGIDY